jgi:hypothetical protein
MESQAFSFKDYSINPVDLIPDDDYNDQQDDRWLEYCRIAATVDRQHVLECVLSDLDTDDSPLYELIDDAIDSPHTPGETPRQNLTTLAKLGQAILNRIANAVDAHVTRLMAVEVPS